MSCLLRDISACKLPAEGVVGSGRWVCDSANVDVTVEEGAVAEIVIVGGAATSDITLNVGRAATLRIVHAVAERGCSDINVALAEDAVCSVTEVVVAPADSRIEASLMERGARFELAGAFVFTDDDKGGVTANVNHIASDCTSRSSYKGVASGRAHGSFSGLVYVAPDAQHTDSEQSSRNITLGDAHIETLPQLEIYADDVKCSHGATVGQADAEAILYMRQRGISAADAKRLQIEGFVRDVVLHSSIEECCEPLMSLIGDKLSKL